jgi:hypothetical protein
MNPFNPYALAQFRAKHGNSRLVDALIFIAILAMYLISGFLEEFLP